MLDILPSAHTAWNRLSGQVGILCGNEYGYCLSPLSTAIWKNPNMVKWCWSKVSNDTNKMVMAWLPGFVNSNATSGETHMKYMFYASIIEGARGVLWYMSDDVSYTDYSNYTYLSGIRAGFTNDVTFKSDGGSKPSHDEFLLKGSGISSTLVYPTDSTSFTSTNYGSLLSNKMSHLVWKYSNRWRLFVANNMDTSVSFQVRIEDSALPGNGFSNAIDLAHATNTMTADGTSKYVLTSQLSAYGYMIYDIGEGNQ